MSYLLKPSDRDQKLIYFFLDDYNAEGGQRVSKKCSLDGQGSESFQTDDFACPLILT